MVICGRICTNIGDQDRHVEIKESGGIRMSESLQGLEQEFLDYVKKISAFEEALSLVYWDLRTGAPEKGATQRSEVIGTLSGEIFKMKVSEEMAAFIAGLWVEKGHLSDVTRRSLEECKKEYDLNKKNSGERI